MHCHDFSCSLAHCKQMYFLRSFLVLFENGPKYLMDDILCVVYSYADSCRKNHNDAIITTRQSFWKNIPLTLIERVMCERELGTEQNCNILTPTLIAISVSFLFSWCWSTGGPGAHSAGHWLSLLQLVTNGSGVQTNWPPN